MALPGRGWRYTAFISGDFDTNCIRSHFLPSVLQHTPSPELAQLAAKLLTEQKGARAATASNGASAGGAAVTVSNWKKKRLAR